MEPFCKLRYLDDKVASIIQDLAYDQPSQHNTSLLVLNFTQIYTNHGLVADWIWSARNKIQYAVKIAYGHDNNRKNKTDKRSIEPTFRYCI